MAISLAGKMVVQKKAILQLVCLLILWSAGQCQAAIKSAERALVRDADLDGGEALSCRPHRELSCRCSVAKNGDGRWRTLRRVKPYRPRSGGNKRWAKRLFWRRQRRADIADLNARRHISDDFLVSLVLPVNIADETYR